VSGTRLAVIGLGQLGLPLSVFYATRGARVVGVDRDKARLATIETRSLDVSYERGLGEALAAIGGHYRTTTDTRAAVSESDVVIVVVPVIARAQGDVDFSDIDAAAEAIARGVRAGTLVIFETTLPVGTTRGRLAPTLLARGALVAYSPERVLIGEVFRDLDGYPKIVGGIDNDSASRAVTFYEAHLRAPVWTVRNAETAEFTKLAETCYRTTNIALANELATIADGRDIDVTEAIRSANSQPYSSILAPGIGVGGHCLPVYPSLLQYGGIDAPLVELGRRINASMARYGVERLAEALGGLAGRRVLVLGVSYRPGVPETAFSPAFDLRDALRERGAAVLASDPFYTAEELRAMAFEPARLDPPPEVDAVVLQTAHPEFCGLDFGSFRGCRVVLDGRNALDSAAVERAGKVYLGIGR